MRKTEATLADGRELFYFDHDGAPPRTAVDRRELAPVARASQLRRDPLLDEWVTMASHRQGRTFMPPTDECPLCPSTPARATEIPAGDYEVAIFENRFPSLSTDAAPVADTFDNPLVDVERGFGRCEVMCFSSDHGARFADLSQQEVELVIEAWADRTTHLSAIPGVAQVFCFESRGVEIGVTLTHPHGQIYAYPFVTPRTERMRTVARRYRERTGGDLHTDVLKSELAARVRIVAETLHWAAYVPAAARWPVEVHVQPRRRVRSIADLDEAERADLAALYLDLLGRFDRLYDGPLPYIAAWHQGVVDDPDELDHLHLQLFSIRRAADKLKFLAGSESGMNAFITDVLPEDVARRLRDV